jgi:DNA-directed RNA polymerase subunit RPC12/RpoP
MSQPFGYAGKPQTCLWCGRKLRHMFDTLTEPTGKTIAPRACFQCGAGPKHFEREEDGELFRCTQCGCRSMHGGTQRRVVSRKQISKHPGYPSAKGHFCSLSCGLAFGVTFAEFGRRLEPKKEG